MFNLNDLKIVKELKNKKSKTDFVQYSAKNNKDALLESVLSENKFLQEDMKLRAMVEDMLQKEFTSKIKNIKDYDFLVDSVVNKLKAKQLGNVSEEEDID